MRIILIGGAPLTGKSTLGKKIAQETGLVLVSTDDIRTQMQKSYTKEDYPNLFYASNYSAKQFYLKFSTPQSVIEGEINESKDVEIGILSFLEQHADKPGFVIEGIAISPEFASKLGRSFSNAKVETRILYDNDKLRIKQRIDSRGLWGRLDSYPLELHETELEWVLLYNEWFKDQAGKYSVPIESLK